jgi:hypothetical protein
MYTVVFEDDGQDFLEWDVDDDGEVVGCRPFQDWVWVGTYIFDHENVKPGDHLIVDLPSGRHTTMDHAGLK